MDVLAVPLASHWVLTARTPVSGGCAATETAHTVSMRAGLHADRSLWAPFEALPPPSQLEDVEQQDARGAAEQTECQVRRM